MFNKRVHPGDRNMQLGIDFNKIDELILDELKIDKLEIEEYYNELFEQFLNCFQFKLRIAEDRIEWSHLFYLCFDCQHSIP